MSVSLDPSARSRDVCSTIYKFHDILCSVLFSDHKILLYLRVSKQDLVMKALQKSVDKQNVQMSVKHGANFPALICPIQYHKIGKIYIIYHYLVGIRKH